MIGFTRDTSLGLGEQNITYMFIASLYDYFPVLAMFAVHKLVFSNSQDNRNFGSWRDIKHICYYLKSNSQIGEKHSLIDYCIDISIEQLFKDVETWQFSVNANSNIHISNIAKHIPRENSSPKFSWLYPLFAIKWINKTKPYIFSNVSKSSSYSKAVNKSKHIFRKVMSSMNKNLNVFQSNTNNVSLDLSQITPNTVMRQSRYFFESPSKLSHDIFDNYRYNKSFSYGYSYSSIPVYFIIKQAFNIVNNIIPDSDEKYIQFINSTWQSIIKSFSTRPLFFLPIVDVSCSSNDNSFYSAIGFAIIMSRFSIFSNRFIAIDVKPSWISINPLHNLINQVRHIQDEIYNMSNGYPDFKLGFDLIATSLMKINSSIAFINNITLILCSHFQHSISYSEIVDIFKSYGLLSNPKICFWNLAYDKFIDLPTDIDNDHSIILSGHNISNVHYLIKYSNKKLSVYESIKKRLFNKRYNIFSKYLHHIVNEL
jgi:hypothetical protein